MAQLLAGATFSFAQALTVVRTVTGITNAAEAVVTATAHGYSAGDVVWMTSGWANLNRRAFRIKSPTADTFVLEGMNTTNTSLYPTGSGAGTVAKAGAFTQIAGVMNPNSSGGDPKTINYRFVEMLSELTLNDGFSAVTRSMEIDVDQMGTPGYELLKSLTENDGECIMKTTLRSGSIQLLPCKVALNEELTGGTSAPLAVKLSISGTNRSIRYA